MVVCRIFNLSATVLQENVIAKRASVGRGGTLTWLELAVLETLRIFVAYIEGPKNRFRAARESQHSALRSFRAPFTRMFSRGAASTRHQLPAGSVRVWCELRLHQGSDRNHIWHRVEPSGTVRVRACIGVLRGCALRSRDLGSLVRSVHEFRRCLGAPTRRLPARVLQHRFTMRLLRDRVLSIGERGVQLGHGSPLA